MNDVDREALKDWVERNAIPSGRTNYEIAFKAAFDKLTESRDAGKSSRCTASILFMSDGDITEGKGDPEKGTEQQLLDFISELNHGDMNARIFTYAFGDNIKEPILQHIACAHQGIWYQVRSDADLASTMAAYFHYFAAVQEVDRVKWTTYSESGAVVSVSGITGCLPVQDKSKALRQLV